MNRREFFKPSKISWTIFFVIFLISLSFPFIPVKRTICGIVPPCFSVPEQITIFEIMDRSQDFVAYSIPTVPVFLSVSLLLSYFLSVFLAWAIHNHKNITISGVIIPIGIVAFFSEFSCVIGYSELVHCQNDYLVLFILLISFAMVIFGIYRFVKNK